MTATGETERWRIAYRIRQARKHLDWVRKDLATGDWVRGAMYLCDVFRDLEVAAEVLDRWERNGEAG